jgi:hypothetical protein
MQEPGKDHWEILACFHATPAVGSFAYALLAGMATNRSRGSHAPPASSKLALLSNKHDTTDDAAVPHASAFTEELDARLFKLFADFSTSICRSPHNESGTVTAPRVAASLAAGGELAFFCDLLALLLAPGD